MSCDKRSSSHDLTKDVRIWGGKKHVSHTSPASTRVAPYSTESMPCGRPEEKLSLEASLAIWMIVLGLFFAHVSFQKLISFHSLLLVYSVY